MVDVNNSLATWQAQFAGYIFQQELLPQPALHASLGTSPTLNSTEAQKIDSRLRVYRNNVMYSLTQALVAQFPVVHRLVGAEFFGALARDYIRQTPPLEASLTYYGHLFADFIASVPACHSLPYLADVATLELHCQRALHAADDSELDLVQLGAVPPEQLGTLGFSLHASALLFASAYPVDRIWAANLSESDETICLDAQSLHHMLIYRRGLVVKVVALQRPAFMFLQKLQQGSSAQEACTCVQEQLGLDANDIAPLLGCLLGLQVFSRFSLPILGENP